MRFVKIKNVTLQTLELYETTPKGPKVHYVPPSQMITIPESGVTKQIRTLVTRRMLKIN